MDPHIPCMKSTDIMDQLSSQCRTVLVNSFLAALFCFVEIIHDITHPAKVQLLHSMCQLLHAI